MKLLNKQKLLRTLRVIHRDLGFFVVGVCFVYGISGFLLNHMDGSDPAYKMNKATITVEKSLSKDELKTVWNNQPDLPAIKKIQGKAGSTFKIMCQGGTGTYDPEAGSLSYEIYDKRPFIFWINKLHYNRINGWNIMGDIFAFSLIFFAVSGLFMVKGKHGIAGRGKWYLLAGLIIPVLYVFL